MTHYSWAWFSWICFDRSFLQDGRIDYNEFVAMMQKSTGGFGKKGHQYNLSIGFRDALKQAHSWQCCSVALKHALCTMWNGAVHTCCKCKGNPGSQLIHRRFVNCWCLAFLFLVVYLKEIHHGELAPAWDMTTLVFHVSSNETWIPLQSR